MCFVRQAAVPCTLHDVIEGGWGGRPLIYPYRCHRCDRCYVCGHWRIGYRWWMCKPPQFGFVPTQPSPGCPTPMRPRSNGR